MSKQHNKKIAIFVVSCDNYSDLWSPFFECFKRFWPDCPFPIYLLSNKKACQEEGVTSILTGDDSSWSDSVIKGISHVNEDFIFMFLDDLFLIKPVNNQTVMDIFQWAAESQVGYVRMNPMTRKADKPFNEFVGIISTGALYRTSTVMALWKKDVLLDLLKPGENAWDFELRGSERSDKYEDFYVTWKSHFKIINTVIRGKWLPAAAQKMKSMGIKIDSDSRANMTLGESGFYYFKLVRCHLFSFFPGKLRRRIRSMLVKK